MTSGQDQESTARDDEAVDHGAIERSLRKALLVMIRQGYQLDGKRHGRSLQPLADLRLAATIPISRDTARDSSTLTLTNNQKVELVRKVVDQAIERLREAASSEGGSPAWEEHAVVLKLVFGFDRKTRGVDSRRRWEAARTRYMECAGVHQTMTHEYFQKIVRLKLIPPLVDVIEDWEREVQRKRSEDAPTAAVVSGESLHSLWKAILWARFRIAHHLDQFFESARIHRTYEVLLESYRAQPNGEASSVLDLGSSKLRADDFAETAQQEAAWSALFHLGVLSRFFQQPLWDHPFWWNDEPLEKVFEALIEGFALDRGDKALIDLTIDRATAGVVDGNTRFMKGHGPFISELEATREGRRMLGRFIVILEECRCNIEPGQEFVHSEEACPFYRLQRSSFEFSTELRHSWLDLALSWAEMEVGGIPHRPREA